MRRVGRVAGQPQRDVRLDRGGQVAGAAVEVGPSAVVALLGADPAGRLLQVGFGENAEKVAQQDVLGVHRDVRLELADPVTAGVLEAQEVVAGTLERDGRDHPHVSRVVDVPSTTI